MSPFRSSPGNVDETKQAPVTVIVGYDTRFLSDRFAAEFFGSDLVFDRQPLVRPDAKGLGHGFPPLGLPTGRLLCITRQ